MAQSGFTPISLYFSATGAAVPTAANLVAGELALNTNDGKLYYKNSAGVVTLLAGSTSGPAGGSNTQVQYNNSGVLAGITGATTNGTALTLVAPNLGTPASATLTLATGLPISTGVSGLGTGIATALAVNVGTAGAPVVNGGALGTPSSGTVTNLTGTASININGTVGATTATTGAFTTVTASTPIGTASGGTGLGGATPFTANGVVYASSTSALATGSALSFDGTNLGIGTSSPAYRLDVAGEISQSKTSNTTVASGGFDSSTSWGLKIANASTTAGTGAGIYFLGGTNSESYIGNLYDSSGVSALSFQTRIAGVRAERMRIDSSGNVGIGTASPANKLTLADNSASAMFYGTQSGAGDLFALANSASEKLRVTNAGTLSGGTSGTAYSFSGSAPATSLTLDASGNLGIGTATPLTKVESRGTPDSNWGNAVLFDNRTVAIDQGGVLAFGGYKTTTTSQATFAQIAGRKENATAGNEAGYLAFIINNNTTYVERARIDSSGNLLVGTTTASAKFSLEYNGSSVVGENINDNNDTANSTFVQFTVLGTQAGTIKRVASTSATVYNTTSDYRLKTVTGSVTGQGLRIDALKPIDYQWKEGNTPARGFLAHEFQTVYPSSVSGDKDAVDADGKPVYQTMQASTSEVIADLVAELQSLRARVAQLESKP